MHWYIIIMPEEWGIMWCVKDTCICTMSLLRVCSAKEEYERILEEEGVTTANLQNRVK